MSRSRRPSHDPSCDNGSTVRLRKLQADGRVSKEDGARPVVRRDVVEGHVDRSCAPGSRSAVVVPVEGPGSARAEGCRWGDRSARARILPDVPSRVPCGPDSAVTRSTAAEWVETPSSSRTWLHLPHECSQRPLGAEKSTWKWCGERPDSSDAFKHRADRRAWIEEALVRTRLVGACRAAGVRHSRKRVRAHQFSDHGTFPASRSPSIWMSGSATGTVSAPGSKDARARARAVQLPPSRQ
jgi:hypothetical protein